MKSKPKAAHVLIALGALGAFSLLLVDFLRQIPLGSRAVEQVAAPELRVLLSPVPNLSVAARVDIVAERATHVVVRYGPDQSYGTELPRKAVPDTGRLSTVLVGLRAGATSHAIVAAHYADGTVLTSGDLRVTTPALDSRLPSRLDVAVDRGRSSGVVMLSMNGGESVGSFAVVIDRSGRVLWYRRCDGGAFAFARLPNGRLMLHQMNAQAFEELDLDGTVVRRWTDPKSVTGADGHDFQLLANGNALLFGAETHRVDTRGLFPKGGAGAQRWDDTVSEIAPDGSVLWRWSSWSRFSEAEITGEPEDPINPMDYEVVHTNSIEPLPDGNVMLSFRNVGTVAKIDRKSGDIVWRLGGKRSDFRIQGDPLGGFHRQHDARLVGPGRILLFDNGNFHQTPESRVVEYQLDENSRAATMVWQYRRAPPLFARISGSVQRLRNGHTLISWGPRGVVTEVDSSGSVVWEARFPGFGVYRARSVPSLHP